MSKTKISKLSDNVTLCLIKNEKFKSNMISVYFVRPLKREEVTKISLTMYLMTGGTMKYKKISDISRKMDSLYGMSMNSSVTKSGERLTPYFKFTTISDRYIEESIFEESLEFVREIILDPLVIDGKLNPEMLEVEKLNLEDEIKSEINDKKTYALKKCISIMCKDEPFSINRNGYIEGIESITAEELLDAYHEFINTSKVFISIEGDFDVEKAEKICSEKFVFGNREALEIDREIIDVVPEETTYVNEDLSSNQGKLVIGYRTRVDYKNKKEYYALILANSILGGGAHSKLFNNVREKESICYYASSITEKYKGIMMISSGIDADKYDRALELIRKEFDDMKKGIISDEEIDNAKKSLINGLKSAYDSKSGESEFRYAQFLSETNMEFEEVIYYIDNTTKEDIVEVVNKIVEDTVYFLK